MLRWKKVVFVGCLLFFGLVACTLRGEREQVSSAEDAPAVQVTPEATGKPSSQSITIRWPFRIPGESKL